jgi:hypothetical protein
MNGRPMTPLEHAQRHVSDLIEDVAFRLGFLKTLTGDLRIQEEKATAWKVREIDQIRRNLPEALVGVPIPGPVLTSLRGFA